MEALISAVQAQPKGKGDFRPCHLDLQLGGKLTVTQEAGEGLPVELDVVGCKVGMSKNMRKGHPRCFRLDTKVRTCRSHPRADGCLGATHLRRIWTVAWSSTSFP